MRFVHICGLEAGKLAARRQIWLRNNGIRGEDQCQPKGKNNDSPPPLPGLESLWFPYETKRAVPLLFSLRPGAVVSHIS